MDIKYLHSTVAELDPNTGIVRGYLAHWDAPDAWGDYVVRGKSFAKTIKENGPKGRNGIQFLLNDDYKTQLGTFSDLWEDNKGLAYEARLLRKRPLGDYLPQCVPIVEAAQKNYNFSHSYRVHALNREKTSTGNLLRQVRLFTGSIIYVPMDEEDWGKFSTQDGDPITDMIGAMEDLRQIVLNKNWTPEEMALFESYSNSLGELLEKNKPAPSGTAYQGSRRYT